MRRTTPCGDARMGTRGGIELRLPNSARHGAASVERAPRLPTDCSAPGRAPGARHARGA
jgi:hypothetical protein